MKTILCFLGTLMVSLGAWAQLNTTLVDFGQVGYGTYTTREVYYTNMSSQDIDRMSAMVTGNGFTLSTNGCFGTIRPGQNCHFQIAFSAMTPPGYASGNLVVYTNANTSSASLTAFVRPTP